MITRDAIETAYSFFHQKLRVFEHSTMEWQRDDIEYAIEQYVADMNGELYDTISCGNDHFLRDHQHFEHDMNSAVNKLENMLFGTMSPKESSRR